MDIPIQITTNKDSLQKKVQIDSFTYMVRRPGAGESLSFLQLGWELEKLEKKTNFSDSELDRYQELRIRSIGLSLSLFDSLGNKEAQAHIDSLEQNTLSQAISQIFGEAKIDEAGETEPTPTVSWRPC